MQLGHPTCMSVIKVQVAIVERWSLVLVVRMDIGVVTYKL